MMTSASHSNKSNSSFIRDKASNSSSSSSSTSTTPATTTSNCTTMGKTLPTCSCSTTTTTTSSSTNNSSCSSLSEMVLQEGHANAQAQAQLQLQLLQQQQQQAPAQQCQPQPQPQRQRQGSYLLDLFQQPTSGGNDNASSSMFEFFFHESPDLHAVLTCDDGEWQWEQVNHKAWTAVLGYSHQELLELTLLQLVHAEQQEEFAHFLRQAKNTASSSRGETPTTCDVQLRCSSSSSSSSTSQELYCWISWTATCYHDQLIVSGRNVTQAKHQLLALQASERRLQESHQIAKLAQWDLDLTCNKLYWSSYIYRLFQIDPTQFGASYEAFLNAIHPHDRELVNNAYLEHLETKRPYEIMHRLLLPDGTTKWVMESCRSEYDADGNPLRSIGTVQDITELQQAQEDLRAAKEKAEEADCLKSAFLANMSHEIRTPMNAVIGFTDLMLSELNGDTDPSSSTVTSSVGGESNHHHSLTTNNYCNNNRRRNNDHREYLETINNSGKLLLTLINDILDISRIEAGQLQLETRAFSLSEVLKTVEFNVMGIISRTGHDIQFKTPTYSTSTVNDNSSIGIANGQDASVSTTKVIDGVKDTIVGDPHRLQQVLNNLLSNAIKFTSSGVVEYKVQMMQRPGGRQMLEFSVRDTGTGIPIDMQQYIFEPFRQGSNCNHTTNGNNGNASTMGGTGLGLSISRKLVEIMGGEISLETSMGEQTHGSTFKFTIPYTPATVGTTTTTNNNNNKSLSSPSRRDSSPGSKLPKLTGTVLVVDDNRVNLKLAERIVTKMGCEATTAENGEVAVAKYRNSLSLTPSSSPLSKISLILMDKSMPVMDGIAAVKAIRQMEQERGQNEHIPIIALTAAAMNVDREECLEAGCDAYLTKPLNREELHASLAKYLAT